MTDRISKSNTSSMPEIRGILSSMPYKKSKRINTAAHWLKMFCLTNFHFHTRFPLLKWIKVYKLSNLLSDIIAGIILTFIMVVQAIAIALVMNVPPQYGIYSSLFGGFVNFLFGTSKDVSIGPTLLGGVVASRYNSYGSPTVVSLMAFFNGLFFLAISFINMGFLMEFISYPVLTGWISSGAAMIFISQLPSWFGISVENVTKLSSYELLFAVLKQVHNFKVGDVLVGAGSFLVCILLYFVGPRLTALRNKQKNKATRIILSILIYIIVARIGWIIILSSVISNILIKKYNITEQITLLNSATSGLPPFKNPFQSVTYNNSTIPVKDIIYEIYPTFFLIPVVVLIETLAGARNFGKQFNYQVDNNQELMCLGIVNVLNSFFSGFTAGGALARTSINALSGCKSHISD
ncbi:hypothetical protein HZS_4472 [Henneguya salminicola]|nr:hypothetical protein HZS_4472 [Henneguya salminicola]